MSAVEPGGAPGTNDAQAAVRTLLDERAIEQIAVAYAVALDTRHWEALEDVFLPDATADLATRDTLVGVEAIIERIRRALDPLDATQHLIGNHRVRVTGDAATHDCYLQAQHVRRTAEPSPNFIVGGRYEDELARTAAGWRIAHRRLVIQWQAGTPALIVARDTRGAP
jgi:3-phenylpropionate/cinnamic acid dioxygenase small subunit